MEKEKQAGQVVDEALYNDVLNRMNITWTPDAKTAQNVRSAIKEAQDYLQKKAGKPGLPFEGENRALLIACAWYIVANKLADFTADYADELLALRLTEGFGCGQEKSEL